MHAESFVLWERECLPADHWQQRHPNIWRLHQQFNFKILQRLKTASVQGATDFVLASETSCFNGLTTIACVYYLSPAFTKLQQLEDYLAENLVAVLHGHLFAGGEALAFCGDEASQPTPYEGCIKQCSEMCSQKACALNNALVKAVNF